MGGIEIVKQGVTGADVESQRSSAARRAAASGPIERAKMRRADTRRNHD